MLPNAELQNYRDIMTVYLRINPFLSLIRMFVCVVIGAMPG